MAHGSLTARHCWRSTTRPNPLVYKGLRSLAGGPIELKSLSFKGLRWLSFLWLMLASYVYGPIIHGMRTTNSLHTLTVDSNVTDTARLKTVISKKVKKGRSVYEYVQINWTGSQFLVHRILEVKGKPMTFHQICRSTKPAYSFASYFEACGLLGA